MQSLKSQSVFAFASRAVIRLSFLFLSMSSVFASPAVSPIDSWHISAVKVSYDNERELYIAENGVVVSGGNIRLQADYVEYSNATRDVEASGNVLLKSGKDLIQCDALHFNLEKETGTLYNGVVFIEENNFYIHGDTIRKTGKLTYEADQASLTSCPGDTPDWKVSAKDIRVTIEGYGVAKNATFWARNIPALYAPIVAFPVKNKRQTGLLTPRISSSDRKGFEIEQPLFLALSGHMDATIYSHYMHKRGAKVGGEFRYIWDDESKGTMQYDYLHDREIYDGTSATSDFKVVTNRQRFNHDRYWLRMKGNHQLNEDWSSTLDIDYVSDADYLHEFKSGYTGYTQTRTTFKEDFGRGIDEYDDTIRKNSFNVNRMWSATTLNMGLIWFDNVFARQFSAEDAENGFIDVEDIAKTQDTTLQRLPNIELNTVKQKIGNYPFYFDLDAEYAYFYRKNTSKDLADELNETDLTQISSTLTTGHRSDIHSSVSLPIRNNAFFLEPSIGYRQTLWYADPNETYNDVVGGTTDLSPNNDGFDNYFSHREMADINVALSTTLSKIFNPNNRFAEKIKHEIIPKLEYEYIPDVDQNKFPTFDSLDLIENRNHVTWTLTSRLTSRKTTLISQKLPLPPKKNSLNSNFNSQAADSPLNYPSYAPDNHTTKSVGVSSSLPQHVNAKTTAISGTDTLNEALVSPTPIYREFAWIELSQSYALDPDDGSSLDFLTDSTILNENTDSRASRRFSDISAEIELSPLSFFTLKSDLKWSPYDNRFNSCNTNLSLRNPRGDSLYARYGYDRSTSESLYTRLQTKLSTHVSAFAVYEQNLLTSETIESMAGIHVTRPCWSFRMAYSDTPNDRAFSFMVNLHGIGEFD